MLLSNAQMMVSALMIAVGLVRVICTDTGFETQPLISVAVIVAVYTPLPTKVWLMAWLTFVVVTLVLLSEKVVLKEARGKPLAIL